MYKQGLSIGVGRLKLGQVVIEMHLRVAPASVESPEAVSALASEILANVIKAVNYEITYRKK